MAVERLRGRAGQRQRRLARTDRLCERCLKADRSTLATVVNHIVPLDHGGTDDDSNTENLCRDSDQEVTADQFGHDRSRGLGGCDTTGLPSDPNHPWNRAARGCPPGGGSNL